MKKQITKKSPQSRTVTISINQQQLDQLIHSLTLLNSAPMNTVDPHYDNNDTFFVSTADTLQMLVDINKSTDPKDFNSQTTHGLCL